MIVHRRHIIGRAALVVVMGMTMGWATPAGAHDMDGMSMPGMSAPTPSTPAPADVQITLTQTTEEGKKQLVATVMHGGKPVEKATVSFYVHRTFGQLLLGSDTTLDDGTAAIAFPTDIPGGPSGILDLSVRVTAPLAMVGAGGQAALPGGKIVAAVNTPFPRALWSPQAPYSLIAIIIFLVGGAWGAYAFVVFQLFALRKGDAS